MIIPREYLGDEARTVLAVYAHIIGEGQRRDFVRRLATAESLDIGGGQPEGSGPRILAEPRNQDHEENRV